MRTTLTIDEPTDLALRDLASKQNMTYKEVINLALKKGLESLTVQEPPIVYRVRSKAYGFQPGVDPEKLNQLVDELESER